MSTPSSEQAKAGVRRRNEQVGVVVKARMEKTVVVAVVKPGRILYEMEGVTEAEAREALRLASHKLSVKTKFVRRGAIEVTA